MKAGIDSGDRLCSITDVGSTTTKAVLFFRTGESRVLIDNPEAVLGLGTGSLNGLTVDGVPNADTRLAAGNYSLFTCHINNRPGGLFRIPDGGTHCFTSDSLNNDGTIHIGTTGGPPGATLDFANGDQLRALPRCGKRSDTVYAPPVGPENVWALKAGAGGRVEVERPIPRAARLLNRA
jgi:hypothetical protein